MWWKPTGVFLTLSVTCSKVIIKGKMFNFALFLFNFFLIMKTNAKLVKITLTCSTNYIFVYGYFWEAKLYVIRNKKSKRFGMDLIDLIKINLYSLKLK